jgi:hypothetical protein
MVEWLNENAYRAFPFEEDSSKVFSDGVEMPNWVLLDAKAVLTPRRYSVNIENEWVGVKEVQFGFSGNIDNPDTIMRILFSVYTDEWDPTTTNFMTSWMILHPGVVQRHELVGYTPGYNNTARITIFTGAPTSFPIDEKLLPASATYAVHQFDTPRRILDSRCIKRPGRFGIDALIGDEGSANGIVHLRDGNNTSLRIRNDSIELLIGENEGLGYACRDPSSDGAGIYFINGQRANTDGSFSISGGDGVQVSTGTYEEMPAIIVRTNSVVDSYAKPK